MFTNKKREGIDTFVCAFSHFVVETPKASIKDHKPRLPIIPQFRHCRVRFCWTTFLETAVNWKLKPSTLTVKNTLATNLKVLRSLDKTFLCVVLWIGFGGTGQSRETLCSATGRIIIPSFIPEWS